MAIQMFHDGLKDNVKDALTAVLLHDAPTVFDAYVKMVVNKSCIVARLSLSSSSAPSAPAATFSNNDVAPMEIDAVKRDPTVEESTRVNDCPKTDDRPIAFGFPVILGLVGLNAIILFDWDMLFVSGLLRSHFQEFLLLWSLQLREAQRSLLKACLKCIREVQVTQDPTLATKRPSTTVHVYDAVKTRMDKALRMASERKPNTNWVWLPGPPRSWTHQWTPGVDQIANMKLVSIDNAWIPSGEDGVGHSLTLSTSTMCWLLAPFSSPPRR
ncbi:hypothetical protein GALMADRAFT_144251 [Galerina marginata CBS 339.88]|uniref:Uncharacterized protein n=1 Tax=Galerina marginata (strain CBS 339.88) TaxID=685588 RepID=A0A067SJP9_GALM3|nr:hypothetical protein GALMADRAFT_144251 [Galerina marginata CBS 339.88]